MPGRSQNETIEEIISENDVILMEAAIVERLRRSAAVSLHPTLVHAPLIYDEKGRQAMDAIYQSYVEIAQKNDIPIFLCTPTWRANQSRVIEAGVDNQINQHATKFLIDLKTANKPFSDKIKVGGLIGCKNDCYTPQEGLSQSEAEKFHSWQIEQLVKGGVDFLIAETLPSVEEAIGIAKAMAKSQTPYFISFVISRNGNVLDGTSLSEAVSRVDEVVSVKPVGFMVNCAFPTFLCVDKQPEQLFHRLMGYLANASSLDHCDLDGAENLEMDSVDEWGDNMLSLNQNFGIKVLGGCCGTGVEHLNYIVKNISTSIE